MVKAILERLDAALKRIEPAVSVIAEQKSERDFRCLTGFNLDERGYAHPVHNGTPECIAAGHKYGDPAPEPWHVSDILDAISPLLNRIVLKYARGSCPKGDDACINDLKQLGMYGVVEALTRGLDRAAEGVQPTTWLSKTIKSYVYGGIGMAGRSDRKARGMFNQLLDADNPAEVESVINAIPEPFRTVPKHAAIAGGKQNPLGEYAPELFSLATELRDALASGNQQRVAAVKKKIENRREGVFELSKTRITGASVGKYGGFGLPHSGDEQKKFKERHKDIEGLTTPGKGGEEIENPELAPKQGDYQSHTAGIAEQEMLSKLLLAGLLGVEINGKKVKLATNEFRALIRLFGLKDYPEKDTPDDPEIDPATDEMSDWRKRGQPIMAPPEVAAELGFGPTRLSQLVSGPRGAMKVKGKEIPARSTWGGSAIDKLRAIAAARPDLAESRSNSILYRALYHLVEIAHHVYDAGIIVESNDEVDSAVLLNVIRGIRTALFETIYDHSYPPVKV